MGKKRQHASSSSASPSDHDDQLPPHHQPPYAPDPATLPPALSFSRGPLPPHGAVARYREVVAPHVESFDYFLGDGLRDAVACLTPAEMRLSADGESGPLLRVWVEECEVGGWVGWVCVFVIWGAGRGSKGLKGVVFVLGGWCLGCLVCVRA